MAVALLVIVLLRISGSVRDTVDALVVMGFDRDRAILIAALIAGGVAATVVAVCAGRPIAAVVASVGAAAAVFGATFVRETSIAMASSGAAGVFDPAGWIGSVIALIVTAAVIGWAAAMLTGIVRHFLVAAGHDLRATIRAKPVAFVRLARPLAAVAMVAVLAFTVPVFSDMVNFTPDAHMRVGTVSVAAAMASGGSPAVPDSSSGPADDSPAFPEGSTSSPAPVDAMPGSVLLPSDLVAGPLPRSLITPDVIETARPWSTSAPSGQGQISGLDLAAPWTGGALTTIHAEAYLPPGYANSHIRYPVLYEVPYSLQTWVKAIDIVAMMNNLIDTGAIPPMIVVFDSDHGGPYRDLECADSFDGRSHFDTYMATKLVPAVDAKFRTIPTSAARALFGDSQGGYCSVALWSHHPDVFGSAVSFSGYFVSGVASPATRNAALPFGSNIAYESAQSPTNVVPRLSAAVRSRSFVILSSKLDNDFFGTQVRDFGAVLDTTKVPMAILQAPYGHSWQTPRDQLPPVLELLAGRMLKLGVFGVQ